MLRYLRGTALLVPATILATLTTGCESQSPSMAALSVTEEAETILFTAWIHRDGNPHDISRVSVSTRLVYQDNNPDNATPRYTLSLIAERAQPFGMRTIPAGSRIDDIAAGPITIDNEVTQVQFRIPRNRLDGGNLARGLDSGNFWIELNNQKSEKYGRIFHILSPYARIAWRGERSSAPTFRRHSRFGRYLKLPVLLYERAQRDNDLAAELPNRLRRLKEGFDQIWGDPCGIELEVLSFRSFDIPKGKYPRTGHDEQHFLAAEWVTVMRADRDIRPEALRIAILGHRIFDLRSTFGLGATDAIGLAMQDGGNGTLGVAMDFERYSRSQSGIETYPYRTEAREAGIRRGFLLESLDLITTFAHEVGHILLGPGHEDSWTNLMNANAGDQSHYLSKSQCETARESMVEIFGTSRAGF